MCDRLGPGAVSGFFWRWFPRLPQVFTAADLRAGYVYELAFRQFEVAGTRVFGRPAAGRAFFEGLIRDHLDVGRPDCVSLTFGRRVLATTPGAFRTKVVTEGVDPQVSCYYKASRIKQYFKGHRALRTDGHLRHPGLRDRAARLPGQLERPAGGRRTRQPASVRR